MNIIGAIDTLSLLFIITAGLVIIVNWRKGRYKAIRLQLLGLIFFIVIYNTFLFLQWTHITVAYDNFEDLTGVLVPMWWAFVFYAFINNITMNELSESERRLSTLMKNLPGMAYRCKNNQDWTFGFASDGALALTGYTADELLNSSNLSYAKVILAEDRDYVWNQVQDKLTAHQLFSIEYRIKTKSGELKWVAERGAGVFDETGKLLGIEGFISDITELKKAENDLRHNNEQLEFKVEERTAELKTAKQQAENANQAKSSFLSKMSHEIRTPMNSILGFTQLLRRNSKLSEKQNQYLSTISNSGEHLLSLINDVLEMSKIESGCMQLTPEPLDLHCLINDLFNMFRIRAENQNLQFDLLIEDTTPRYISSDSGKIREVLLNLLSNALKFTKHGGIVIRIGLAPEQKHVDNGELHIKIEVEDTGCGIAETDIKAVFTAFEQADKDHWHKGTGLGMPISRQFARMMGGDLNVKSRLGHGSTFTFTFNAEISSEAKISSKSDNNQLSVIAVAPEQKKFNILIADDDDANLTLLTQLLDSIGFDTCKARDGEEAAEIFKKEKPDAVLMDYHMPKNNGLDATRKIKSTPEGKDTPVIIVTASALDQSSENALAAGASSLIKKPYLEDDLLEEIKKLTGVKYLYSNKSNDIFKTKSPKGKKVISNITDEVKKLPEKLISEMRQAILEGSHNQLLKLISTAEMSPELAGILRTKADSFEYENLEKLLNSQD